MLISQGQRNLDVDNGMGIGSNVGRTERRKSEKRPEFITLHRAHVLSNVVY
jgi:hypothetical protein